MFCYDTQSHVTSQPIVTTCYGKEIVSQDNMMVTQDSTLTTTVKQVIYLIFLNTVTHILHCAPLKFIKHSTESNKFSKHIDNYMLYTYFETPIVLQELDEVSRKYKESPGGAAMATRVVSPDSVTDNEMWALLQAKQMLLFLVEQFLPLETADSPSLTTLLSVGPFSHYFAIGRSLLSLLCCR